jgi:uncharacterized protein YjbI with pentapeptide repeats
VTASNEKPGYMTDGGMAGEAFAALTSGRESDWQTFRSKPAGFQPVLTRAALARSNLSGYNLRNVDFEAADLAGANLAGADLSGANLSRCNLGEADLTEARLIGANLCRASLLQAKLLQANLATCRLRDADLTKADLSNAVLVNADLHRATMSCANLDGAGLTRADMSMADLSYANLHNAYLVEANLSDARLTGACLVNAHLERAMLLKTDLTGVNLSGSRIYGVSAWNLTLEGTRQENLIIVSDNEATITVDNIEIAQFVYLLLNNDKIRDVINTVGKRGVLLLGRFSEDGRKILERMRQELRKMEYLPIVFDFERPEGRTFSETVRTLAGLCQFVIADLSQPRSVQQELRIIIPDLPIPIAPIIRKGEDPYAMFSDFLTYPWVLKPRTYASEDQLAEQLINEIVPTVKTKVEEIRGRIDEILKDPHIKE